VRIAVAQIDPTVGDLAGNVALLKDAHARARAAGADLVVAPELAVTGYPPRDLLDRPGFVRDAVRALAELTASIEGPALLCGAVVAASGDPLALGGRVSNGAVLIRDRQVRAVHRKMLLPTYDVFDEARYFVPGTAPTVVDFGGVRLGVHVCEDAWNDKDYWREPRYERDPVREEAEAGAELLINISASPYDRDKPAERERMLATTARARRRPFLYVNQIAGNDALIFDGRSVAFSADGTVVARSAAFAPALDIVEYERGELRGAVDPGPSCWEEDVVRALTLGLGDYARKCGFERVVVGLSGGIDSALTAALAARALGPQNVIGIMMPSRYSSEGSRADARELGKRLGIRVDEVAIEPMFQAFLGALAQPFAGMAPDVAEENLQARIRGTLLMAYSNKFPRTLLLTTGNKSELGVGYCTLYGDMAGGLAPISDLYKTEVYAVSRWLNQSGAPIPEASLTKPPSAELRPNQTDQDTLPPYEQLDAVLRGYVDHAQSLEQLVAAGHPLALVRRVIRLVESSEYKRRQMPPGLRVSLKAFGEGRRIPIAHGYRPA
jgi:NAD+ synthase (glutamine-hydrolysing)